LMFGSFRVESCGAGGYRGCTRMKES